MIRGKEMSELIIFGAVLCILERTVFVDKWKHFCIFSIESLLLSFTELK